LAISKRLVILMGGNMWVKTQVGVGSTFSFTVRLKQVGECDHLESGLQLRKMQSFKSLAPSTMRILVAEDNAVNAKLLSAYLSRFGFENIDLADNGRMAFEMVVSADRESLPFHVVFMDVQMPEMSGIDATQKIRNHQSIYHQPKIVACTAGAYTKDRDTALQVGMNYYLAKPIQLDTLRQILEACTRTKLEM
jgi:CheY-like chemotaxis protein